MTNPSWTVAPAKRVRGTVRVPGDKSISHRSLILSALSEGTQEIRGLSTGLDVASTARILGQLGAEISVDGDRATVGPTPSGGLREPDDVLDCGNSGTSIRLLSGLLAGQPFLSVLSGDESLRRRPMARVTGPLTRMGAIVDGRDGGRLAPLTIRGGGLKGIEHVSEVASAQVKSCLMLAGLFAEGELRLEEPHRSRDHTERMLAAAGVELEVYGRAIQMRCGQRPRLASGELQVPADISGAAFFAIAALVVADSRVDLPDVGMNETRDGLFRHTGCIRSAEREALGEERADLRLTADFRPTRPLHVAGADIPSLIDEIPILAVLAARAPGVSRFRDAADLRAKESDRIKTTAAMLRTFGVEVRTLPDGFDVHGRPDEPLTGGGTIDAAGDHRIAMSAAVAALAADAPVTITGTDAVDTSFPGFLPTLESIVER